MSDFANFNASIYPDWLESLQLPDDLAASAYESTPPQFRALLKTAIAMADNMFGKNAATKAAMVADRHAGFQRWHSSRPVDIAIIIFPPAYRAAARMCAAAILPLLAGVPDVCAICIGANPAPQALAALELCGVQDIFCFDICQLAKFFSYLRTNNSCCAGIVLREAGALGDIVALANKHPFHCYVEARRPKLYLSRPDLFDPAKLVFAHGFMPETDCPEQPEAVYCSAGDAGILAERYKNCRLFLAPDCEGFWLFPDLEPNFFRLRQLTFSTLQE